MRRLVWLGIVVGVVMALGYSAGLNAAAKAYQFTGTVKTVEAGTLTVEKSASEIWTFSTDASTKGTAKVGDKVTVHYTMVATDIEAKAAPAAKKPRAK